MGGMTAKQPTRLVYRAQPLPPALGGKNDRLAKQRRRPRVRVTPSRPTTSQRSTFRSCRRALTISPRPGCAHELKILTGRLQRLALWAKPVEPEIAKPEQEEATPG